MSNYSNKSLKKRYKLSLNAHKRLCYVNNAKASNERQPYSVRKKYLIKSKYHNYCYDAMEYNGELLSKEEKKHYYRKSKNYYDNL